MKLMTKPYGEIDVAEKQKIAFPQGIIGFEKIREYYILDAKEGPFYWLQAAEYPELAFLLMNPRLFKSDYRLEVLESDLTSIGVESPEDCLDFVILTIPQDPSRISANLMGPIIVNRKTRVARQVISTNDEYTTKYYIMDDIKDKNEKLVKTG
jgi:flagellar assembly factor FliW